MGIKLIVSDLDGTLLNNDKKIDSEILNTIKKLEDKNIMFTIATGRNYYLAKNVVGKLNLKVPYIINNGAQIVSNNSEEINERIPIADVKAVCNHLIENDLSFLIYSLNNVVIHGEDYIIKGYQKSLNEHIKVKKYNVNEELKDVVKITVSCNDINLNLKLAKKINKEYSNVNFVRSEGTLFTITSVNATKGQALSKLCNMIDIELNEVMVFGDNYNDISMLDIVEESVKMSNSTNDINAKYITKSNNENGVSDFIKSYFNLR